MTTTADYKVVHTRQPRLEGVAKATGKTAYVNDLRMPRMVHVKVLRSPHAHAMIKRLDTTAAKAYPGVVGVFTADDLPPHLPKDSANRLYTAFADKEIMFYGQAIAAVVSEDPSIAEEALDFIKVEYEELPAVMDILDALKPNAPVVRHSMVGIDRSELLAHTTITDSGAEEAATSPNITHRMNWSRGNMAEALQNAEVTIERSFRTSWVYQGYIEPFSAIVDCDLDENYRVWLSTQGTFSSREGLSRILGVPENKIVVEYVEMGGGFGAKIQPYAAVIPAIIARILHRPVKHIYTRSEDIRSGDPAPQAYFDITLTAKRDGTLTGLKARAIYDSGSFPGSPLMAGANLLGGYYKFPNLEIDGIEVITNRVSQGALRAPGTPQATFAIESAMDELARELKADPIDLRLKNCVEKGDPMPNGRNYGIIAAREVLNELKQTNFWKTRKEGSGRPGVKLGVGIALGGWLGGSAPASASVMLNSDGSVSVLVGTEDITGIHTSFAQIAAEVLGLPIDQVRVNAGSTASAPFAGTSAGSKSLRTTGLAVQKAAEDMRNQILAIAAPRLDSAVEDLEVADSTVRMKTDHEKSISFEVLGTMSTGFGSPVAVIIGTGHVGSPVTAPGFALQGAKVEVDELTGEVTILSAVCVQDVGFAINPMSVEGQIQGGVAQALAIGLSEEMVWDDKGVLRNPSLLDYRLPTALDVPPIEVVLVEVPVEGAGPYGAKGVGEPPIAAGATALANAVTDAIGVRVTTLPVTAERILAALGQLSE